MLRFSLSLLIACCGYPGTWQGTAGFMTGFAFPEILAAMNDAAQAAETAAVRGALRTH